MSVSNARRSNAANVFFTYFMRNVYLRRRDMRRLRRFVFRVPPPRYRGLNVDVAGTAIVDWVDGMVDVDS